MSIEVIQNSEFTESSGTYFDRIIHETKVDFVSRNTIISPIHLVQYDNKYPIISIKLYKNNDSYYIKNPSLSNAKLRFSTKNNKAIAINALGCSEDYTTVYMEVIADMTANNGIFYPVLEITNGDLIAAASPLKVIIHGSPNINEQDKAPTNIFKSYEYIEEPIMDPDDNIIGYGEKLKANEITIKDQIDVLESDIFNGLNLIYNFANPRPKIVFSPQPRYFETQCLRYLKPYADSFDESKRYISSLFSNAVSFNEESLRGYAGSITTYIDEIHFYKKPMYFDAMAFTHTNYWGSTTSFGELRKVYCNWDWSDDPTDPVNSRYPWGLDLDITEVIFNNTTTPAPTI